MWYDKGATKQVTDWFVRVIDVPSGGFPTTMKAEISHVGRCDICKNPASYVQTLGSSRFFRYCEQHVPEGVMRAAQRNAQKAAATTSGPRANPATSDSASKENTPE
jgi:hypothetical protein